VLSNSRAPHHWVKFPEVPGPTTDSLAEQAAAGAKIEHFRPTGTGTYSGRLQADNSTWAIKSTYVQLRPCVGDQDSEVAADCDRDTAGSLHRRFQGRYAELSLKNGAAAK
jgi:hypothetical protein